MTIILDLDKSDAFVNLFQSSPDIVTNVVSPKVTVQNCLSILFHLICGLSFTLSTGFYRWKTGWDKRRKFTVSNFISTKKCADEGVWSMAIKNIQDLHCDYFNCN